MFCEKSVYHVRLVLLMRLLDDALLVPQIELSFRQLHASRERREHHV